MKKLLKILLNRRMIVILLLLVQVITIVGFILGRLGHIMPLFEVLSLLVVLYVVNRRDKPAYKIAWIIIMLTVPVFGGLLYIMITWQSKSGAFRKYIKKGEDHARSYIPVDRDVIERFNTDAPGHLPQVNYLTNFARFPMYDNSVTEYFSPGEVFLPVYMRELEAAKEFIFLEFFIINTEDRVWRDILDILKRKASEGVEVRIMYDDLGCIGAVPDDYTKTLAEMGIKCTVFNPFRPFWSSVQNNRDHRKITVIDGKTAFTGGINLADEYINEKERFGYWLDSAVSLKGEAVNSFTVMFLELWNGSNRLKEDFSLYLRHTPKGTYADGYILPYADAPTDDENVCEHVYMQIINNAKHYVYIETPYFIIDDSMLSAIILAAKSGVDIRIITPAVPDKKLVHMTTRSYYDALIKAGVRVYEYTPGFVHSKLVVSDDDTATVGTANFDFRSLYLHYECGELIFNSSAVEAIKQDFLNALPLCREIKKEDTKRNIFVRFGQSVLRIIAPLL
ncbi:MAG: cardiolipin synthase [Clostridia bacterium]|nr:cardiolipin synthase [Clostridia bacterium]